MIISTLFGKPSSSCRGEILLLQYLFYNIDITQRSINETSYCHTCRILLTPAVRAVEQVRSLRNPLVYKPIERFVVRSVQPPAIQPFDGISIHD